MLFGVLLKNYKTLTKIKNVTGVSMFHVTFEMRFKVFEFSNLTH